ncbi:hypothetical protein TSUD_161570 [Trifolium subterraneum]|uniref:TF-B3 domain-containing protein n=1 Tax=Trifolium subterraneum TaxID=3900 RepID=A0A2Z6M5W4_TRISU|nr:hypothetical protein TSUD_161570 [Trifolium subterraneum]
MTSGRVVANHFGFNEPTEVILDYQVVDNSFTMSVIKNENLVIIESDDSSEEELDISDNDSSEISSNESADNIYHLFDNDSNMAMHEFLDDRFYGWKLKVSKAYADKTKSQVMHIPLETAKSLLRGKKYVYIKTPHKLNGIRCTITKAMRKAPSNKRIKETYLTTGWYDWVRANDLMEGDELQFQIDDPLDVIEVQIVRANI